MISTVVSGLKRYTAVLGPKYRAAMSIAAVIAARLVSATISRF
jgi:hypothetical protein